MPHAKLKPNFNSDVMPNKFDVRIRRRNITRGVLSRSEIEKHLSSLPDESKDVDTIEFGDIIQSIEQKYLEKEKNKQPATPIIPSLNIPDVVPVVDLPADLLIKMNSFTSNTEAKPVETLSSMPKEIESKITYSETEATQVNPSLTTNTSTLEEAIKKAEAAARSDSPKAETKLAEEVNADTETKLDSDSKPEGLLSSLFSKKEDKS